MTDKIGDIDMNITERHMDFLKEAKIVFKDQPHLTTWRDADNTMIALLHSWEDQESQDITIIEIGETVARFEGCLKKEINKKTEIKEGELVIFENEISDEIDLFIRFLTSCKGPSFTVTNSTGKMAYLDQINNWIPKSWLKSVAK